MRQLDRIEAKLDRVIELVLLEPYFIKIPHEKQPQREWAKAVKVRQKAIEKLKLLYENTNDSTRKPDSIS